MLLNPLPIPTKKPDIIAKLKKENLLGKGGGAFPAYIKWEAVLNEPAQLKFIVVNGSEGEPNVFKDGYIIEKYPETLIKGIKVALDTIDNSQAYIYLRKDYYKKFKSKLEKLIKNLPIKIVKKGGGYLAGEETVMLNSIENQVLEPRLKPPFPTQKGLFGYPTLINNIETFYDIAKIAEKKYKNTRFYSISGDKTPKKIYELPSDWSIEKVLKHTKNYPKYNFYIQAGGGAMGTILFPDELKQPVHGAGAIIIHDIKKTPPMKLMKNWAKFFRDNNCDKCTPCREGLIRLNNLLNQKDPDIKTINEILNAMRESSFCPFGKGAALPFQAMLKHLK